MKNKKLIKTPIERVDFPEFLKYKEGKVRQIVDLDDKLLIVTTDRISAFDYILKSLIPFKGIVLSMLSLFWFDYFEDEVKNHIISGDIKDFPEVFRDYEPYLLGRSVLVKKAKPLPVECIVRGYLSGSGWKEYLKSGEVCGISLPEGLEESEKLSEPIFTPSTKAEEGHDENITFEKMCDIVGRELGEKIREISISLYLKAHEFAYQKGIIVADTKMEFGIYNGELILIDEIFTPDCSRFWPLSGYEVGKSQVSYDKQFVRDFLLKSNWDRKSVPPPLPDEIVSKTSKKYLEIYKILTGEDILTKFEVLK